VASIIYNILLGALPESIYFSLFMIFAKNIKTKRVIFCVLMFIEYALLMNLIQYNIWFQISYTFVAFVTLKVLYKEKALITDIFVFCLASIILILISMISYMAVYYTLNNYIVASIVNRVILFGTLFLFRNKFNKLCKKLNSLWNRKQNQKIRSLTVRNIVIIIFNLTFALMNFGIIYAIIKLNK